MTTADDTLPRTSACAAAAGRAAKTPAQEGTLKPVNFAESKMRN